MTLASAVAAMLVALVPFIPASADDLELDVGQQAWFWSSNQTFTFLLKDRQFFENLGREAPEQAPGLSVDVILSDGGPKGIAPVPPGTLSPISFGHLGVSLINGSSDMRSYIKFNTFDIPEGSKVESFRMRLTMSMMTTEHLQFHLEAEAHPPSTFNEGFARIDACPVTEPWALAEGTSPYQFEFQRPEVEGQSTEINRKDQRNEPFYDCGQGRVRGELVPSGDAMVWDLTSIAQRWIDEPLSNEGVVLMGAAEGGLPTWVVEFHGAEYSLAPTEFGLPVPLPVAPPDVAPPAEDNHYVSKDDAGFANVSFSAAEPTESPTPAPTQPAGTTTTIIQPGTTQTIVQPGQPGATQVVYAGGQPTGTVPVGDVSTPGWVFLAFPLGLLALGAVLGAVGKDEIAMAAVPIAGSRVASMLRQRRLGS